MADQTSQVEYLVQDDLGPNGGPVRILDPDGLEEWVKREREFWGWLDGQRAPQPFPSIKKHILNELAQMEPVINQARQELNQNVRNKISAHLEKYKQQRLLHSTTAEAKFISRLADDVGVVEALAALSVLLRIDSRPQLDTTDIRVWSGIVSLVMYKLGISERANIAHNTALAELVGRYNERFADDSHAGDALKERLEGLVNEHENVRDRGLSAMARAIRLARERAQKQKDDTRKELDEFESHISWSRAKRSGRVLV